MPGELIIPLLILVFVAIFAWQFVATKNALATTRVESTRTPQEIAQMLPGVFGGPRSALWTDAHGPGSINMRRRGKDGGITMSIDIAPRPTGGSTVDMWASTYNQYLGVLANFAGSVNSRKKAISRLLVG